MSRKNATHDCVIDGNTPVVCLGRCKYNFVARNTTAPVSIGGIGNRENAYTYVGGYAEAAAGKSAPARFTGAVLHGLVEEAVDQMQHGGPYQPSATARNVYNKGLAMWVRKNYYGEAFGERVIETTALSIIQYAEQETKLPRTDLVFLSEFPVVVSYGPNNECWPRFADLVVARRNAAMTPLMVIDLYFTSQENPDLQKLCIQKLKALRYIKSIAVRRTIQEQQIKLAVLAWARPNLGNMASLVTYAGRPPARLPRRALPLSIYLKGERCDPPSKARLQSKKNKLDAFISLFEGIETMLVKVATPVILDKTGKRWFKFPTVVAQLHVSTKTLAILTPLVNSVVISLLYGANNWTMSRIAELDTGTFKETIMRPIFIGKALDTLGEEKRGERLD